MDLRNVSWGAANENLLKNEVQGIIDKIPYVDEKVKALSNVVESTLLECGEKVRVTSKRSREMVQLSIIRGKIKHLRKNISGVKIFIIPNHL